MQHVNIINTKELLTFFSTSANQSGCLCSPSRQYTAIIEFLIFDQITAKMAVYTY